jgi:hypothetical protein
MQTFYAICAFAIISMEIYIDPCQYLTGSLKTIPLHAIFDFIAFQLFFGSFLISNETTNHRKSVKLY